MRRKRVLLIFAVLCATSLSITWLGSVLAAASLIFNEGLTVAEAASGTITNSLLQADDPDVTGETLTYTLVTTPTNGFLALNSTTLNPTDQFTQADIDSSLLVYTHNDSETSNDSFDFTVATITDTIPQTTFLITVTPVFDQNPVVLDQEFDVFENSTTGTPVGTIVATDLDAGDSLTYTIIDGNFGNPFALGSSDGAITVDSPTPLDFETNEVLTFTVEIEDLGMITDTAVITVNVLNQNEPPTLDDDMFTLPENSANTTPVGTMTADDPDAGETYTYTITANDPVAAFGIGSTSGQITVTDTNQLDFETTPTFTLTIQVEDSGLLTDTAEVVIELSDANDAPVISPAGPFFIPENSANGNNVGTPISATDQDLGAGDVLAYTITAGDSGGAFSIGGSNGQIIVNSSSLLDFETTPTFTLTVQVEDSGMKTDNTDVVIHLDDVNEPPNTSNATYTPNENLGNGEIVGDVLANDPEGVSLNYNITNGDPSSAFDVNSAGQIIVNNSSLLDFETTPSFTLTVAVDDGFNPPVEATIFINLKDLNETPSVSDDTFAIDENSNNGTAVGTVTASDPDIADDGNLTFDIISGNISGAFAISNDGNNNGDITVANSNALDFETTEFFVIGIIVTDTGNLNNTASVTININNLFDEAPTVSDATYFVSEGDSDGVLVGTVSATDPELTNGDELTFSFQGGNIGNVFQINSSNGQITVPDISKLDADGMPTFNLTVQASDRGGQVDTATITVNVSPLPINYIFLPTLLNNYPLVEPNNNCNQAYGLGSNINYEFTADDQEDWYSFTLINQQNATITLSGFEPASGQLIVYGGSCGSLMLLQNNGSASSTKVITLNNLGAGTYYIRVFSFPITNTPYNLRLNLN